MTVQNPRRLIIPDYIHTERLALRIPRPEDSTILHQAVLDSLEHLRPWMEWAKDGQKPAETASFVRRAQASYQQRDEFNFVIWRRTDNALVGVCGMHHIDWVVPRVEIGYWGHVNMTGQGYITEATNALTKFAFETLHAVRIEIRCDAANTRSAAVAERAGYTLEATLKQHSRNNAGQLTDTLIWVRLAEQSSS